MQLLQKPILDLTIFYNLLNGYLTAILKISSSLILSCFCLVERIRRRLYLTTPLESDCILPLPKNPGKIVSEHFLIIRRRFYLTIPRESGEYFILPLTKNPDRFRTEVWKDLRGNFKITNWDQEQYSSLIHISILQGRLRSWRKSFRPLSSNLFTVKWKERRSLSSS